MTPLHDGHDQILEPLQEVFDVCSGGVSPVSLAGLSVLRRCDIHTTELSTDHRRPGLVLCSGVNEGVAGEPRIDGFGEHFVSSLVAQDPTFHLGACLC